MLPARVLLIDDDPFYIRRARTAFDDEVDLQVATTCQDALAAAASWHPDVVVLDLLLGDADPFLLLDALRARCACSPSVICLSRGPGSATRFHTGAGEFLATLRRDAGPEGLREAVTVALQATPSAA